MPFLPYDPKKKPLDDGQPKNLTGETTSFNQSPPGASASNAPKSSGRYSNIQTYLNANKEQAADMGSKITSKVETNAVKASEDVGKLAAEKPTITQLDPNRYLSNPTANTDEDIAEYQALKNTGGYTGPEDISKTSNYSNAQNSVNKADSLVKATATEDGRMGLLKDEYTRPNYQRGAQILDQTLLQNDTGSKDKFAELNQKYSGISSLFDNTVKEVGDSINQGKTQALKNKQDLQSAEKSTLDNLYNPIQERAAQFNSTNQDFVNRINSDIADKYLSQETLDTLGVKEFTNLFDLNLQNYATFDTTQAQANNLATPEERQKFASLMKLLNGDDQRITLDGKEIKPVQFNNEKFKSDVDGRNAEFRESLQYLGGLGSQESDLIRQIQALGGGKTPGTYTGPGLENSTQIDALWSQVMQLKADAEAFRKQPSKYAHTKQALIDLGMNQNNYIRKG